MRSDSSSSVTVVFGAHTYSRTKGLFRGFVEALSLADHVILTDIYAAREEDEGGVSVEMLAVEIGADVCPRVTEIREKIDKTRGSIIIMGAADLRKIKNELISKKY